MVEEEPLDRPARRRTILRLEAAGILSPEARDAALEWLEPRRDWWGWSSRTLLIVGSTLVLAGIVFFFAFNWARIGPLAKFAGIEILLLGALAGAWKLGLDRLGGKICLLAATLLVGVFLAVYGQVYQTGADAWEVFAGWAALTAGWAALSRFAAHVVAWLAVAETALILWWGQVSDGSPFMLAAVLGTVNAAVLAGREVLAARGHGWAGPRWGRVVLWLGALVPFTLGTIGLIVDAKEGGAPGGACAALLAAALAGAYFFYRRVRPDLGALALGALAACSAVLAGIARVLFEISDGAGAVLLFGLIVIAVTTGAAMWLRRTARVMEGRAGA